MTFDNATNEAIAKRMKELDKDPEFSKQLDKEIAPLKGRNLKRYIAREAIKRSEKEGRKKFKCFWCNKKYKNLENHTKKIHPGLNARSYDFNE